MRGVAMHKYLQKVQKAFSHRYRKPITSSTLSSSQIKKIIPGKGYCSRKRKARWLQKSDTPNRHVLKTVLIAGAKKFSFGFFKNKIAQTKQDKSTKLSSFISTVVLFSNNKCLYIFVPPQASKTVWIAQRKS